ncbi:MAG TPA: transcription antitermination factor NusB [Acidimicrobiales bacterium]|nr:transcription antitermination factor NusB [Acidimicrobiales bacterium]
MQGSRRQARERALSLLYEASAKGQAPGSVLDALPVPPDEFTVDLVRGVESSIDEVDGLIASHAIDWTLDRMPVVDLTLLRVATYELCHRPDIPTAAVISEAVELAGEYSTDESGRFVNGVLAAIAGQVRPEESSPVDG